MNKKGLSILLALSMVFSLNTMAFAEEAAVVAEEDAAVVETAADEVEVQYDLDDETDKKNDPNYADYEKAKEVYDKVTDTQSLNGSKVAYYVGDSTPNYTGKKLDASDLGIMLVNTDAGYAIPVKKIKLTGSNKKANATGFVTYNVTGLYDWKYIQQYVDDEVGRRWTADIPMETAKALYKDAQSQLKSAKNTEMTAYIRPRYISGSVSNALINTLKKNKTLSDNDLIYYYNGRRCSINNSVIVNAKGGNVKNVKLVNVSYKLNKADPHGSFDARSGRASGVTGVTTSYKIKISTKTLKKGVDYTVSGDSITFKGSANFNGYGAFKAMD